MRPSSIYPRRLLPSSIPFLHSSSGNAVRVNNSMINEDPKSGQKVLSWALGRATVPNEEKNNKLIVVFEKIPAIGQWFINKLGPNYWVMDTDYDNYAIGKSKKFIFFFNNFISDELQQLWFIHLHVLLATRA